VFMLTLMFRKGLAGLGGQPSCSLSDQFLIESWILFSLCFADR
jgi:hypothetical protein